MSRRWLPHPPATIRPAPCPTGQPRYTTRALALAATVGHVCAARLTPAACPQCGGIHLNHAA
ncbi:hypothetical protein [Streptomyces sp. NPDC060027]|uniref:hypothetical protein n=1 Tax=Streptomyces sp. NPDC060027 TaxID=3347040 RepID=UPI0036B80714